LDTGTGLRRKALLYRTLVVFAFLVLWELLAKTGLIDPEFTSLPTQVVPLMVAQLGDPSVLSALAGSGRSILASFVIGSAAGMFIGSMLGLSKLMNDAYMGPVLFLMSIPKVIFLPIFVLVFGLGSTSAIAFASFEALTYVAVCVADGMSLVQARHLRVARAYNASMIQRFLVVVLPAAWPGVFTGLWFGIKHAFIGVLTAELWASSGGVGALTRRYAENLQTPNVLALVLIVSIVAIILGSLWNAIEIRLTSWK
jgi:ABC-type nitrate/sulfonate/bicarbonate transport system permease component